MCYLLYLVKMQKMGFRYTMFPLPPSLLFPPNRDLYAELHVAELLAQILSAVDYLHSRRVVHLDLKSDNMLVTDCNVLKIVDLGSAQSFTPGQTLNIEDILGQEKGTSRE